MIISKTPFRISLFGGGTDYPKWYREHGGAVIGTAIDKYCYITVRTLPPFFKHKHRIVYSNIELVQEIDEIDHPAVRAVLSQLSFREGLEVHHDADLPARSGLGSSSSFTVGLLNALNAKRGQMMSKDELSREAIRIEQEVIGESVGSQDQIWAAHGGFNRIDFLPNGDFEVTPIILGNNRLRELKGSMQLFFTGFSRYATEIAKDQIENMDKRTKQLTTMRDMVDEAMNILQSADTPILEIGKLLDQSWKLKRELASSVTTPEIDEIYKAGLEAGAVGGKLLGAGGGGFIVFFAPPENHMKLRERLKDLVHVSFDFDKGGSKIMIYEPDQVEQSNLNATQSLSALVRK
ncbi:MAG: kinase [Rhodospirillaceae bacterium]|jgi:D-glycero-alpha-D-manno-heptose-7-phosphate kinase|nr:kinase [Rhodospirillaceae bacterium]MBT5658549.1 kinase [Rhodospirillaceae bacterium]MBT5752034.1 kinase [Rhodospirillaceae bacterium]